ncbi:hypothetical protein [Halobacterium sp. R2-5]|uniref:hypothetical protein n=1 Tax=Halobacterium sp. R2-5 TaxID=2715751 RepID=UPI001420BF79|nr:hypothetical protein [Halobacterium sp. R2-5]NIC00539.1 hypothetical protein [Halobacterium sp. R2-5]
MKRRTYLAALSAAAVAGCTGAPVTGGGDGETTAGPTTTTKSRTSNGPTTGDRTTNERPWFRYAIDGVRTADAPLEEVTMDARVTREFSVDHPARLEVSFTNTADEERTFVFGSLVPWDGLWGQHQSADATMLLAPDDGVVPDGTSDDCWQATDGVALPEVMREETVDPGATVRGEFAVLAAHDSDQCHPHGTYRFEKDNYLESGWWFELDLVPLVEG